MNESIDNVTIEVTISVKQKSGWDKENVLTSAKQLAGGTFNLESIGGVVSEASEQCLRSARLQLAMTQEIKRLEFERKLKLEFDNANG